MNRKLSVFLFLFFSFFAIFICKNTLSACEDIEIPVLISKSSKKKQNNLNTPSYSFVFVILAHVRGTNDNLLWKKCYKSIRKFYPDTPIVIIDDNSPKTLADKSVKNTIFIRSEYPGAGEILPYHYFLTHKWADKMIFLHDSMYLIRPFTTSELNHSIKFHWHFEKHLWDNDHEINMLLSHLPYSTELIDYNMNHKSEWNGCFGVASIIDLNLLEQIENKYSFTLILKHLIQGRDLRMSLERIFGMVMFKEGFVTKENCSNFGSIHDFPRAFVPVKDSFLEIMELWYPGAIIKTWQGR